MKVKRSIVEEISSTVDNSYSRVLIESMYASTKHKLVLILCVSHPRHWCLLYNELLFYSPFTLQEQLRGISNRENATGERL